MQVNELRIEGYVSALSEKEYSYFLIQKRCDIHGIKIPSRKKKKKALLNRKEKTLIIISAWKEDFKQISEKGWVGL